MDAQTIRVLFVDDDPEDAYLAEMALRQATEPEYEMQQSRSLSEAYEQLQSSSFDVVLLDLGLPGSQGLDTLDEFRRVERSIPVVVLSGLDNETIAIRSLERGAQDYLFKSEVTTATLSRAIRYAIQRQSQMLEISRLLELVRENEALLQRKNDRLKTLYDTAHNFVDNVSHEFRTPLTVIKEYVSLVREGALGDINDEQSRFLRIAEDRADDLNTMVDDMLDVSKLEAGLLAVNRGAHAIHDIVSRIYPALKRKADVKDLALRVEICESLPSIYCDPEKIQRVIINLAVNAMKFTKPHGNVCIWAKEHEDDLIIGVSDDGPGIAPDSLQSIFDRFEQVDIDVRSSTKGFGLGLNIAKELVELNLGRMGVESEVGEGTTFTFTVPKSDPARVTRRYLSKLARGESRFISMLLCSIDADIPVSVAGDVDVFLSHLIRGNYLSFRLDSHRWLVLIPEPESEARLFIERADRELEKVNRNRPKGPLPQIDFAIEHSWFDLHVAETDILDHLCIHLESNSESLAVVED